MSGSNTVIQLWVWNRFTWRAQVLFFSLPRPAPSCPTGCGPAPYPGLYPLSLPPWWPLHTELQPPQPPNTPSSGSVCPSRTLPKATGNSWRVCGPVSPGVELTGAPVFVSTFPHYHWIMVIINMVRPGGVLAAAITLFSQVLLVPHVSSQYIHCCSLMKI